MSKKTKLTILLVVTALAVLLFIAGYILLPDVVSTQITSSGTAGNTMPKLLALLLPFAVSEASALFFYFSANDDTGRKNLIVAAVGLVMFVLTFVFNL